MIDNQETIKKIRSLGLNTYEVKIWTALLSRGISTAGELSDIANVPRSRSYDVLESLEKKGFVVMKLGKPIKYLAIPPKKALEKVKVHIEKKTKNYISKITNNSFNNLINNLQEIHDRADSNQDQFVAVLKGKNIQKHLEFLFRNAKENILLSIENKTERYTKILKKTQDGANNIDIRIITNKKNLNLKENFKLNTHDADLSLCIVDDNVVIFPISEEGIHPDYDLAIWIKNKQTSKLLNDLLSSQ